MMNTSQLLCCIHSDSILNKHVKGVFPADQLPKNITAGSFIANTDKSHKRGQHWCAFYFDGNGRADFFDSYGRRPEYYDRQFLRCLQDNSTVQTYNDETLQNSSSNVCGQFSLFFLIHRCRGLSMDTILKLFQNIDFKDQYVYKFISETFPYCTAISSLYNQTCVSLNKIY